MIYLPAVMLQEVKSAVPMMKGSRERFLVSIEGKYRSCYDREGKQFE